MRKKSVITIGTFDGVHKGHRFLIGKTLELAKKKNLTSIVVSLEKPVKKVSGLLTTCDEKVAEIKSLGVDKIVLIKVPSAILSYTPTKFFEEFLVKTLNVSDIICGADFTFGKNGKGNLAWLRKKAKQSNVKVKVVKYFKKSSNQISSSCIRTMLEKGDVKNATELLGSTYSFSGVLFKDKGIGEKLGFPTINLKVNKDKLLPRGVYLSLISQEGRIYPSVTSIGSRLTFNRGSKIVPETHILNFNGVWKKTLTTVALLKKIRDEKKFDGVSDLKFQISKDIARVVKFFDKKPKKM